jgi:hypothetical protein
VAEDAHSPRASSSRVALRGALAWLLALGAFLLVLWAAIVLATGGFAVRLGVVRLSSRSPRNALIAAATASVLAWFVATREDRRRLWHRAGAVAARLKPKTPTIAAGAAAVLVLGIGIAYGIGTATGADSYGYVSQGELWMHGLPRIEEPLLTQVNWPNAASILSPIGSYRPAPDGKAIVPIYPAGYPLVLAVFERLGGRGAVFYAVPMFAALTVLVTYVLGSSMGGRGVGALAAVLLATSPVFIFQDLFPMSDVPVTMWWALSLLVFVTQRPIAAAASGLAAGMAILTRPNLAPLAAAPILVLAWHALRFREPPSPWLRWLLFCTGVAAGCVALAVINARLYGSPFAWGYGPVSVSYAVANIPANVRLYTAWTLQSQTLLVFCAAAAPITIAWRSNDPVQTAKRAAFAAAIGVLILTVASYLPYFVFDRWFWLRFLLPAWPPLLVLTSLGLVWLCGRVVGRRAMALAAAIVILVGCRNVRFLKRDGVFRLWEGERKSPVIGRYITERMPGQAVFLAKQQGGSVRYYSGRLTLRFDMIPPTDLDRVIADLVRLGYHPYGIFEDTEEATFRSQFARENAAGALDWPPIVQLRHSTRIQIYDFLDMDHQKSEVRAPRIVF